jgi:hypothetical protein
MLRLELERPVDVSAQGLAAAAAAAAAMAKGGSTGSSEQGTQQGGGGAASPPYPINWLRNAGIRCVRTSHYLIVDVDFWPSTELLPLLRRQLAGWDPSATPPRALVVPNFQRSGHGCRTAEEPTACREAFESGGIAMPRSFAELQACLQSKDCVVFDGEYNPQGQASTDVKAWRALPAGATRRIPCITSERYEPYVALLRDATTPMFDERFTGCARTAHRAHAHNA